MIFQLSEKPLELTKSVNVKLTDTLATQDLPSKITLTFSKDGQKLIFIDNKVRLPYIILIYRASLKYLVEARVDGQQQSEL
jgi:hypothetical protein